MNCERPRQHSYLSHTRRSGLFLVSQKSKEILIQSPVTVVLFSKFVYLSHMKFKMVRIAQDHIIESHLMSFIIKPVGSKFSLIVSSKVDFHQSGIEKGTRERVRSKVAKFGYHYKFLSSF